MGWQLSCNKISLFEKKPNPSSCVCWWFTGISSSISLCSHSLYPIVGSPDLPAYCSPLSSVVLSYLLVFSWAAVPLSLDLGPSDTSFTSQLRYPISISKPEIQRFYSELSFHSGFPISQHMPHWFLTFSKWIYLPCHKLNSTWGEILCSSSISAS